MAQVEKEDENKKRFSVKIQILSQTIGPRYIWINYD